MIFGKNFSHFKFAGFGFAFGLIFPAVALFFVEQPWFLFAIISTAPIVLGLVFFWTGKYRLIQQELLLEKSKSAHKAKLASLGEVAAGVAHEINNPLAIIGGSARLLEKYRNDPEKFRHKIESIQKSIDRIANIVNGLRKFARTDSRSKEEIVSLKNVLDDALTVISIKAQRASVPIHVCHVDLPEIKGSAGELSQVFVNLLGNAIDATANLSQKWVRIENFETETEMGLRVTDSGSGIPKEIEEKLFQPFFTTKPVGEGTGLGLSISKEIAEQNGAELRLNKDVPNTCFEIVFSKNKTKKKAA